MNIYICSEQNYFVSSVTEEYEYLYALIFTYENKPILNIVFGKFLISTRLEIIT